MDIIDSPFELTAEPFLTGIAAAVVKSKRQDLRQRARILVEQGSVLMGINMGMIANAHMDFADTFVQGAISPQSQKALVRMYIVEIDSHPSHSKAADSATAVVADADLQVHGLDNFYDSALCHKEEWRHKIQALMVKFGVHTEAELVVSGHENCFRARAFRKKKKFEVQDQLRREMQQLRQSFREIFVDTVQSHVDAAISTGAATAAAPGASSISEAAIRNRGVAAAWLQHSGSDLLPDETADAAFLASYVTAAVQLASAWYEVTYNPAESSNIQVLSLPWIVSELLVHIKSCKRVA